jgi:hypothetical protein
MIINYIYIEALFITKLDQPATVPTQLDATKAKTQPKVRAHVNGSKFKPD